MANFFHSLLELRSIASKIYYKVDLYEKKKQQQLLFSKINSLVCWITINKIDQLHKTSFQAK